MKISRKNFWNNNTMLLRNNITIFIIVCVIFSRKISAFKTENINSAAITPRSQSDHFLTLSADCSEFHDDKNNGTIRLILHTSEPFFGSIYSRDHQSTCKVKGNGATATKLLVSSDKECGVKRIKDHKRNLVTAQTSQNINSVENEDVHEISLYVQHDEHVQQVIDEQFLVQCWNGMAQGLVSYQDGHSDFTEKTLSRTMVAGSSTSGGGGNGNNRHHQNSNNHNNQFQRRILDMVPLEPMTALPIVSNNNDNDHIITAGEDQVNMIEIVDSSQKSRQNNNIQNNDKQILHHKASGWMEIVDAANDEALDESIQVGSPVSLVIRLRQFNSMDTMLSTCTAHSGDDFYDLTNFRGCTADPEILPNFKAFFNSRTGVKRLKSTFPMFKFPDENKVIIRCTVVVCNKNCPVAKCDQRASTSDFQAIEILDKFYLETFAEVHDPVFPGATVQVDDPQHQVMRTPPMKAELDTLNAPSSNYHKSSHEVIDTISASSMVREEIVDDSGNGSDDKESDLLCLSPSRLALAFGILLVILLLALLASCTLWMRARAHLKRPKPMMTSRPPRPPAGVPAGTLVPARASSGPFLIASRPPYLRVIQ